MKIPAKIFEEFTICVVQHYLSKKQLEAIDLVVWDNLRKHSDDFVIKPALVSKELGVSIRTVQRALQRLRELNLIEENKKEGKLFSYKLGRVFATALKDFYRCNSVGVSFEAIYGEGEIFCFKLKQFAAQKKKTTQVTFENDMGVALNDMGDVFYLVTC